MTGTWRTLTMITLLLILAMGVKTSWTQQKPTDRTLFAACQIAGTLGLCFRMEPGPPPGGKSLLKVALTGPDGNPVMDAKVTFLASMPGMEAMMGDVKTKAALKGTEYVAEVDLPMEGQWRITLNIARRGKPSSSTTFEIDVKK